MGELSLDNASGTPTYLWLLFIGGLLLLGFLHVTFRGALVL